MQYAETLHWILDKNGARLGDEAKHQENIAFVHSLGLKCDCVGWSKLDLSKPTAPEILDAIEHFCKTNGWSARGHYTRTLVDEESQWYCLRFDEAYHDYYKCTQPVPDAFGGTTLICSLKAYQEKPASPKKLLEINLVPDRFRKACLNLLPDNAAFCWAEDKGPYQAEQYFHIYPRHAVSHLANTHRFHYLTKGLNRLDFSQQKRMRELGGSLPRLAEIFSDLHVETPNCYLSSELPETGLSSAFVPGKPFENGFHIILIHKDTAEQLLQHKALPPSALMPALVLDDFPAGYQVVSTGMKIPPDPNICSRRLQQYEILIATPRPVKSTTEKEALKIMRCAKKERKADFQKAMPKNLTPTVLETEFGPLVPYYLVANGGYLSDEYFLLPYQQAVSATHAFFQSLESEELLEEKPRGIVIAKCPDGDSILLCKDGFVIRFSHEAPLEICRWDTLSQFIAEAIQDEDTP